MKQIFDLTNCFLCPYHPYFKCLDPVVGSAIATGASNLIGSLANFFSQKNTNKMHERMFNTQMDYVKAAEERQYAYQDKAWQRETEYNSPAAQRARFEAAGLNPAMMMEGQNAVVGSMGEPSTPSAPSPPSLQAPQIDLTGLGNAINSYYQNAVLQSQMNKTDREGYILGIEGQYAHQKAQLDLRERLGRIDNLASNSSLSREEQKYYSDLADSIRQQIAFNDASFNARLNQENKKAYLLDQQGQLAEEEVKLKVLENSFAKIEHDLNIEISKAQKRRLEGLIYLDQKQADKLIADISKSWLESAGLTPGTEQWKRQEKFIDAQIKNALRIGLPFGVSLPGSGDPWQDTRPARIKAAKRGRLW